MLVNPSAGKMEDVNYTYSNSSTVSENNFYRSGNSIESGTIRIRIFK